MIVFFGQPGVGKSTQGKMLAANNNWHWVSAGQLLRESNDPEIHKMTDSGVLVPSEIICKLIGDDLNGHADTKHIIIDGFARNIRQARWLIEDGKNYNRNVELVIVLSITKDKLIERLVTRGREDDTEQAIKNRLDIYDQETLPVLDYFKTEGVNIAHIDGLGTPEEVYERIMKVIKECKLA